MSSLFRAGHEKEQPARNGETRDSIPGRYSITIGQLLNSRAGCGIKTSISIYGLTGKKSHQSGGAMNQQEPYTKRKDRLVSALRQNKTCLFSDVMFEKRIIYVMFDRKDKTDNR